jgi:O-antigen/teichoic acid export membrane protein
MAAAFIWTFWLGPEALGAYAIIWAVQELASRVMLGWWSAYVKRYVTTHEGDGERIRLDRMEMAVQLCAAGAQAGCALPAVWIALGHPPSIELVVATIAFTLTRNLCTHFSERARAQFETLAFTLLQLVGSVLGLTLGLIAVAFIERTPEALLWSYALAQLLGLTLAIPLMRFGALRPQVDWLLLQRSWVYGAPVLLAGVFAWGSNNTIRFVIEYDQGVAAVGLVTVGWWLGQRLSSFAALLVTGASFNVAVERLRQLGPAAGLPQLAANAAFLLAILCPTVAGALLLNEELVGALVAGPYRQMTVAVLPLALITGTLHAFRDHTAEQALMLFARTRLTILTTGVEVVATVILCWVGLRIAGAVGAASGCMIAAAVAAAFGVALAHVKCGFYIRPADLLRIGSATAAMALAVTVMPHSSTWSGLAIDIVGGATIYFGVIAILYPAIPRQLIDKFRARLQQRAA